MLGLRAWGDDLVAVLFEFLDDDTKLACSTGTPSSRTPAMCVTLWALMGAGGRIETSTRKTHGPIYSFSVEKNYISEMTERCFLGEKRVLQPFYASSALSQLVLCFWDHLFVVILDQKSPAAVRCLPHRERRCVEASLVQFSHNTHFLVAISSLFVMLRSPRGRLWK